VCVCGGGGQGSELLAPPQGGEQTPRRVRTKNSQEKHHARAGSKSHRAQRHGTVAFFLRAPPDAHAQRCRGPVRRKLAAVCTTAGETAASAGGAGRLVGPCQRRIDGSTAAPAPTAHHCAHSPKRTLSRFTLCWVLEPLQPSVPGILEHSSFLLIWHCSIFAYRVQSRERSVSRGSKSARAHAELTMANLAPLRCDCAAAP